jgi:hypothetical protein
MLRKKGLIFTLDGIFAILIALTLIFSSIFYLSQASSTFMNQRNLIQISQDSLTLLEKTKELKNFAETSTPANIQSYLDSLPYQICAKLSIESSAGIQLQELSKSGCGNSAYSSVTERRVFVANSFTTYYAEMEAWYK